MSGSSVDELVSTVVGRGAPLSHLTRQRPRFASSSVWAYRCVTGNLRRICNSAAPDDSFDGHGRGWSRDAAIVGAVAEALERYAATLAGVGPGVRFGAAAELGAQAVAPEQFVRMSCREREDLGIDAPPADARSRIGWCAGHDLAHAVPALLPAQLVCLGYNVEAFEAQVQFATSKGLAAHWTDDAAILHGLLECIEADAFMVTYLNRLPVPEIDIRTVPDARIAGLVRSAGSGPIECVRAWNITTDCRIPTVLVAIFGSLHNGPVVTFGSAAAPDPVTAVTKAVQEAIHTSAWLDRSSVDIARRWTTDDFGHVQGRAGHKPLGTNPLYVRELAWLFEHRGTVAIDDLPPVPGESVGARLSAVVDRAAAAGMSCYACDLTPPDLAEATGMRVWRVLVPQAQPFVLAPVRYLDSRRLREVPVRLGYRSQPLPEAAFNPVPHPCP